MIELTRPQIEYLSSQLLGRVATTGADGRGKLRLSGRDGDSFDIAVGCPDGYQSPAKPVRVILRRLADATKKPE